MMTVWVPTELADRLFTTRRAARRLRFPAELPLHREGVETAFSVRGPAFRPGASQQSSSALSVVAADSSSSASSS